MLEGAERGVSEVIRTAVDRIKQCVFNPDVLSLAASKNLQKAGMDAALAETVAMEIGAGQYELATKSEIQSVRNHFNWLKWEIEAADPSIQFERSAKLIALLFGAFFVWL